MSDKPVYSSGKDPLSGQQHVYQQVDGRRTPILVATHLENRSLSLAAVTHNIAMLLNGQGAEARPLASPAVAHYHRPASGESMILRVLEGGSGSGTSIDAVQISPTGSHRDLGLTALAALGNQQMHDLCGMFDSRLHPAPQGGPRYGAPNLSQG